MLVILVPVLFAFMGFAFDLGHLYLVRGEMKTAANSMALAAAARLNGTEFGLTQAGAAARIVLASDTDPNGLKYDFGTRRIDSPGGGLLGEVQDPAFYETYDAASGIGDGAGDTAGATARHVRIALRAETPLTFWTWVSLVLGREPKTPVAAVAVAGMSAPLCTACGIEPLAVQALDVSDATHFGFTPGTRYTLGYYCTGGPDPGLLGGTTGPRIPYVLVKRLNDEATVFADERTQLYRTGAQGLPPNTNPARACISINAEEQIWASAAPMACNQVLPGAVRTFLCGIASRFDTTLTGACVDIPESETLASNYIPDPDITDNDDYTTYTGNGRRVITVAMVESAQPVGTMTILGFRQFFLEPNQNDVNINVNDRNGRFVGMYIGSVVPVRQGRFDGCRVAAGPGKVVLHQ